LNAKEEEHKKELGTDAVATVVAQEAARRRMLPSAEETEWVNKINQHKIKK
jgi:hypothetical protein